MNSDQFDDLKQFIVTTVSQAEVRLGKQIDRVETRLTSLEQKVDDGFAGVAEAIDVIHKQLEEQHTEFDTRLTKLERRTA